MSSRQIWKEKHADPGITSDRGVDFRPASYCPERDNKPGGEMTHCRLGDKTENFGNEYLDPPEHTPPIIK